MDDHFANPTPPCRPDLFASRRVAIRGKLAGVSRRELTRIVREHGGEVVDLEKGNPQLVVLGADEEDSDHSRLSPTTSTLIEEFLSESQLWERLGLIEEGRGIRRLYTAAMLAKLINIPITAIRRWTKRGLLVPVREIYRVAYYDFREVSAARRLVELTSAGASSADIERRLAELSQLMPEVERPLADLPLVVRGGRILVRRQSGLVETGGQLYFDFDALEESDHSSTDVVTIPWDHSNKKDSTQLEREATYSEENGQVHQAIEIYRSILAAKGPTSDVCFQLADALYRIGDISAARERYFMAIELDENFVEARANLGCVLAETGERELAIAAFQGALAIYPEYADVHYHLARTLDDSGKHDEAEAHWRRFLELAPDSPWADEASERMERVR